MRKFRVKSFTKGKLTISLGYVLRPFIDFNIAFGVGDTGLKVFLISIGIFNISFYWMD